MSDTKQAHPDEVNTIVPRYTLEQAVDLILAHPEMEVVNMGVSLQESLTKEEILSLLKGGEG